MPHIHTDPGQHDLTACAYIVRMDLPEPALLLHRHRKLNKWLQFGGHVELDENLWQAVRREIREESGYEPAQLKLLQPDIPLIPLSRAVSHPWPVNINTHRFGALDHYHNDIAYAFTASQDPRHKEGDGESAMFRSFERDALAALTDGEIPANVRETGLMILDYYLKSWRQVDLPETD